MPASARGTVRALAVLVVLAASFGALAKPFANAEAFEPDWCQHLWWTQRFADPTLFPGDEAAEFFSRPLLCPPGVRAWYGVTVPWIGAEPAARTLSVLLVAASVLLAWRAGRALAPARPLVAGLVAALVLGAKPQALDSAMWGLPRSFSLPLHLLGILAVLERRAVLLGVAGLLSALLYPPALVVTGLAAALAWAPGLVRERRLPARWPALALLGAAALAVLLATYRPGSSSGTEFGPKVTREEAKAMPELWKGGRSAFFRDGDPVRYWLTSGRSGLGLGPTEAAAMAAGVLALLVFRRRWLPPGVWALLGASLLAFLAAHATLFALHLPNRYTHVAIPLFTALAAGTLAGRFAEALRARWDAVPRAVPGGLALALVGVVLGAAVAANSWGEFRRKRDAARDADFVAARAFLGTLPVDAVVAAHPYDANTVPLRARRSVLASYETAIPYWKGYYRGRRERLEASLDALHATSWETVDALAGRYRVSAFLVDRRRLEPAAERVPEPIPFEARVGALLAAGAGPGFVLANPPPDRILFRSGSWAVVRVGPR
jgi:hypothetical protein